MDIQHALPPPKINPPVKGPVVLTVKPDHGPTFGTNELTITGLWFGFTPSSGLKAHIGDVPCDDTIWVSESIVKCIVTASRPARRMPVIVVRDGVWSNDTDSASLFYEYREFSVTKITPMRGPTTGGTILNITGKNFGIRDFDPEVTIGGVPCVKTLWLSTTMVQCVTPPNFGTNHSIVLAFQGMKQLEGNQRFFFDYDRPKINAISIDNSPTVGNVTVDITGENFGTVEAFPIVTVGGVGCLRQFRRSHTELSCSVPPGVGKFHRVVVTTLDGRYSTAEEHTVSYHPPMVASISPNHGVDLGKFEIVIKGINFGSGAASPDLTPRVPDWSHRRLMYARKRRGRTDSWGPAWNASGLGWLSETAVEENEAKKHVRCHEQRHGCERRNVRSRRSGRPRRRCRRQRWCCKGLY
jgi:hypothetical protein